MGARFHEVGGVWMFGEVFESWFHGVGGVLFHGVGGVMMLDRLPRSRWAVWWRDGVRTRLSSADGAIPTIRGWLEEIILVVDNYC